MTEHDNGKILDDLWDLKKQLKELRVFLAALDDDETATGEAYSSSNDEFKVELTPNERNALLFSPLDEGQRKSSGEAGTGVGGASAGRTGAADVGDIREELSRLKDRQEKELDEIKKYISVLSEMWGRHELEIAKIKKYSSHS